MGDIVLFGATGYTGRLTTAALVARGARPILAGRTQAKLDRLAEAHGGLETRVADVGAPASVRALVGEGDVLISTVGPFARFGAPAIEAAIDAGAHYVDSTGEPAFIRRVFEEWDGPARGRGVALLTAFGYDYVPGHCAAGMALQDAGERAVRVDVGYFMRGRAGMSQGTAASLLGAVTAPGIFFRDGRRQVGLGATSMRHFDVRGRPRAAVAIPGTEQLALPATWPQLRDVRVYLGWFGKATSALVAIGRANRVLVRVPGYRRVFDAIAARKGSQGEGPSDAERSRSSSLCVAIAYDAAGEALARVELRGPNGYDYTAEALAWGATRLAQPGPLAAGALGPIQAFGLDAVVAGNAEIGLVPSGA